MESMSFKEALENEYISIFDDECAEILKKAANENVSDFYVQEYVGPVISEYLINLIVNDDDLETFKQLVKPIKDSFMKSKKNSEAEYRRLFFKVVK